MSSSYAELGTKFLGAFSQPREMAIQKYAKLVGSAAEGAIAR
jgi:hypothetical protein